MTDNSEPAPEAEISLAPGYIQANLKILTIEDSGSQKIISSEVLEILNYGSSTDPVPSGSSLKFVIDNELFNKSSNKIKQNGTLTAILSIEQSGMMMGNDKKTNLWKLITINN
ncbi:MAG: hypothetical protein JJ927_15035 [Balneola sp.]|nr:hypothetical protein [Balneola sp.]MBO6652332.1 hypothetical protein [Balneola sp.]MBO6869921.1 hypothetical protein [Balneola sp.]